VGHHPKVEPSAESQNTALLLLSPMAVGILPTQAEQYGTGWPECTSATDFEQHPEDPTWTRCPHRETWMRAVTGATH
jgi:hypothetical protein